MNKWGKEYWVDLGERVGSTVIAGVTTMIIGDGSGVISGDAGQWWLIVGVPTALVALKVLASNLRGGEPTASMVGVSSAT